MLHLHHSDAKVMHKKSIKALTLRNLPEEVQDAIRKRAEETGWSFSRALVSLLQDHLGIGNKPQKKRDFSYMRRWSQEEYDEFMKDLADQRRIYPKDWQ